VHYSPILCFPSILRYRIKIIMNIIKVFLLTCFSCTLTLYGMDESEIAAESVHKFERDGCTTYEAYLSNGDSIEATEYASFKALSALG
jgi:hypothetical protein